MRVLLLPAPGEQHTFGLVIVSEFFRRAGWEVHGAAQMAERDLRRLIGGTSFPLAGLTLGSELRVEALAAAIRLIRATSCNPDIRIMVGGPLFVARPELAQAVGADATAVDGRMAVAQAHHLLNLPPAPP
jgi:methanogenic corrinoid protein MtbC1